jgi:hypothetical protein
MPLIAAALPFIELANCSAAPRPVASFKAVPILLIGYFSVNSIKK